MHRLEASKTVLTLKRSGVGVAWTGCPGTYLTPSSNFFSKRPYFTW
nr:MAG TPA_asm: hypothetical protein [Bacteriophage sp.]